MNKDRLIAALSNSFPVELVNDLVDAFLTIRLDVLTRTLGRTAPGKFVETVVQILQYLEKGQYEQKVKVEHFLKVQVENCVSIDEGLRICAARTCRAIYSLRNKRNIAHKNEIDPSTYDLEYIYAATRWVMAEFLRQAQNVSMEEAGTLIDMINAPVGPVIEEMDGRRLVYGTFTIREEILVLMLSLYPDLVPIPAILESLDRRNGGSVRNVLRKLYIKKLIQGNSNKGYRLTSPGYSAAILIVSRD